MQQPQNDTISIIIPVHNRANIIPDTLASVATQTWRPIHVILVDNNSTDETADVLKRWKAETERPGFKVTVLSETQPGACAARNAGLAAADSEWTMFFDSDDIMQSGHIDRAMSFAAEHPDAEIIGWDVNLNFLSGKTATRPFYVHDAVYNNITQSVMATQRYMARTALFRKAGGWDNDIKVAQDVEIGNRLLALNPKIYKIGGIPTVDIYESEVSITNSAGKLESMSAAMRAVADKLPNSRKHWADLQTIILAARWTLNADEADPVAMPIIKRTPLPRRWLWRFIYKITLANIPGGARFYQILKWTGI